MEPLHLKSKPPQRRVATKMVQKAMQDGFKVEVERIPVVVTKMILPVPPPTMVKMMPSQRKVAMKTIPKSMPPQRMITTHL